MKKDIFKIEGDDFGVFILRNEGQDVGFADIGLIAKTDQAREGKSLLF